MAKRMSAAVMMSHPDSDYEKPEEEYETPERLLVRNVLERGLRDALALSDREESCQSTRRQATVWLLSNALGPFGFLWCCDVIGLTQHTRERLRQLVTDPDPKFLMQLRARLAAGKGIVL